MLEFLIGIAIAILLFLFFIFLVIFAPKSENFFKEIDTLTPFTKNSDLICDTFVRLGIQLDDDNLAEDYASYYSSIKPQQIEWLKWPDEKNVYGCVEYLPVHMFGKMHDNNYHTFNKLFNELSKVDGVQSVYFIKLGDHAHFKKHHGWAEFTNTTLRFIYCFNSFCYNEDECGIWVNGEAKKLFKDYYYIYDASKEHSLYNNTVDEVLFLVVDFDRPKNINSGYSDNYFCKTETA